MYSAYPLPLSPTLPWSNATEPGATLPVIMPAANFDPTLFAARDGNLAYRDILLGAFIAQVATALADAWGAQFPYPTLNLSPIGNLQSALSDLPPSLFSSPGSVVHVDSSSVPMDGVTSDQYLYARDLVIYAWLQVIASFLPNVSLPPITLSPRVLNDAWSLAYGNSSLRTASPGYALNVDLLRQPDQSLAGRDNNLAAYLAQLRYALDRSWTVANRFLVSAVTPEGVIAEPEIYNLVSVNGNRVWASWPLMDGTSGQLAYQSASQTLTWQDEVVRPATAGVPAQQNFTSPDGSVVNLNYTVPSASDAEFFHQKSARIPTRPWRDDVVFATNVPEDFIISGGLWQPSGALITTPGVAQFALPTVVPSGAIRLGLLVKPSRVINLLGYQNTAKSANGTAVTLNQAGSVSWSFAAPAGGIMVSFEFLDQYNPTPAFQVQISYAGVLIYNGAWAYGQNPGTPILTPAIQITADGNPSLLTVTWLGNPGGQLTINEVQITTALPAGTPIDYSIAANIGGVGSPTITVAGYPERQDCIWLDLQVQQALIVPTLAITWFGAAGIALYIEAYDIHIYTAVQTVQNPFQFEGHKHALLKSAEGATQAAWTQVQPIINYELRTTDPVYGFIWDVTANGRWVDAISLAQPRLTLAFRTAGPCDLGRPALVPPGLQLSPDGVVLATLPTPYLQPALQICQPWMIAFGALVADTDFWPTLTYSGQTSALTVFLAPSFSFSVLNPVSGTPSIVNMTSVDTDTGTTLFDPFTAYNLPNVGPGGGANTQSITLTVYTANLGTAVSYTLTQTLSVLTVSTGITTTTTLASMFTATGPNDATTLSPLVAAAGTVVKVLSVALS